MGHLSDTLSASVTDDWMTPPEILAALGPFDLDPCAVPECRRPWPTAARHIARPDDGLTSVWEGRVWLNPPYSDAGRWVGRLAGHHQGTALIFARTETQWFADYVWGQAAALLFLEGRVRFARVDGHRIKGHNAPAPSVLVAYGDADAARLASASIAGAYVHGWRAASGAAEQPSLIDASWEVA